MKNLTLVSIVVASTVLSVSASAQISSLNNGVGYTSNNAGGPSAVFSGNSVNITTGYNDQHNSVFYNTQQTVTGFNASFDYQANGSADGFAFVLQNAGINAVSNQNGGSGLSYQGMGSSVAMTFNIYSGHPIGTQIETNGSNGNYISTNSNNFNLNGDLIGVNLSYNGSVLTENLTDLTLGGTFHQTYATDIASIVGGSKAYVGFTGACGGATSTQTISNFTYQAVPEPSSYAAFGLGIVGLVIKRRRK